jgi:hypothetical protein
MVSRGKAKGEDRAARRAQYERDQAGRHSNLALDVLWVYEHLLDTSVTKETAISLGTWALLEWAKRNTNHFMERLLPKALAVVEKSKQQSGETEQELAEKLRIEELEKRAVQIAEGTKVTYCQSCWKQLGPSIKGVEVVRTREEAERDCPF